MLRNLPPVTKNLLLLNVVLYFASLALASNGTDMIGILGSHYFNSVFFEPYQVITHMFMHSLTDFFHILMNMFLLVMFGAHLERIWGGKRFFIFYFACGLGALVLYNSIGVWQFHEFSVAFEATGNSTETVRNLISDGTLSAYMSPDTFTTNVQDLVMKGVLKPEILNELQLLYDYCGLNISSLAGASGAIFGLLAGFAMLFPNTQLILIFPPIPIKAKYLIGGYIIFEVYNSINHPGDQIAHLAHVGGAVVGIIFILVWRKKDRKKFW